MTGSSSTMIILSSCSSAWAWSSMLYTALAFRMIQRQPQPDNGSLRRRFYDLQSIRLTERNRAPLVIMMQRTSSSKQRIQERAALQRLRDFGLTLRRHALAVIRHIDSDLILMPVTDHFNDMDRLRLVDAVFEIIFHQ